MKEEVFNKQWQINKLEYISRIMGKESSELKRDCYNKVENFYEENYEKTCNFLDEEIKRIENFIKEL